MLELETIINAVIATRGTTRRDLIHSQNSEAKFNRKLLIHTAKSQGVSYKQMSEVLEKPYGYAVKVFAASELLIMRDDRHFLWYLNATRKKLKLPPIAVGDYRIKKNNSKPIDYSRYESFMPLTVEDKIKMAEACADAAKYMQGYGKGVAPLKAGYAVTRQTDEC